MARLATARILKGASALAAGLVLAACGGGGGAGALSHDVSAVQGLLLDAASNSEPGELAAGFLRDSTYTSIVIEVDYPAGHAPSSDALETLASRLDEVCRKPAGVTVVLDDAIPPDAFPESQDAASLESFEHGWRDRYADESTGVAVLYVLCVPGGHVNDTPVERVLGMAFGGSSVSLFLDSTDRDGDVFATTAEMRAMILIHESCHVLGLVNHGIPMVTPHEDAGHANHCASPGCLLNAAPVLPRLGPEIADADFAPLCPHCLADLAAYANR